MLFAHLVAPAGAQSLQEPVAISHDEQGSVSLTQVIPSALHVCGVFKLAGLHRFAPGWQIPPHTPDEQMFGHTVPAAGQ